MDNFTQTNMSEEEAFNVCRYYLGVEESEQKVKAGVEDIKPWTITEKGSGLDRWNDCIGHIKSVHGKEEMERVICECTK